MTQGNEVEKVIIVGSGPAGDGHWRIDTQVGAGIVADSEPTREYQEMLNKAQGMLIAPKITNMWGKEVT